jgi:hypothetical protein
MNEDAGVTRGLDLVIAAVLLAVGCFCAGYLGFNLLDPHTSMDNRLTSLGMMVAYPFGAFFLAARARKRRWNRPVHHEAILRSRFVRPI